MGYAEFNIKFEAKILLLLISLSCTGCTTVASDKSAVAANRPVEKEVPKIPEGAFAYVLPAEPPVPSEPTEPLSHPNPHPPKSSSPIKEGDQGISDAEVRQIQLTRFIGVNRQQWNDANISPKDFSDLYTRIEIETTTACAGSACQNYGNNGPQKRSYALERRGWLARLLSNRTTSITAFAKAEIRDPDVATSLPLFSVSHNSIRGSGEVFVTTFTSSHVQAPLFRIGPNTTLTIHLKGTISDKTETDATAMIVQAVQDAISIAAPTSSVLTALSRDEVSRSTAAFDSMLGGLFSQDITENIELGRLLDTWQVNSELQVQGAIPWGLVKGEDDNVAVANGSRPDKQIGTWHIKLTCPRPSLFSAKDLCKNEDGVKTFNISNKEELQSSIISEVSPSLILQTKLGSGTTVQEFIQIKPWYTAFIGKKEKNPSDTKSFCTETLSALYALGLNNFDSMLVLRAMSLRMPGISTLEDRLTVQVNCVDLVARNGTGN